jgi:hypothetical protein
LTLTAAPADFYSEIRRVQFLGQPELLRVLRFVTTSLQLDNAGQPATEKPLQKRSILLNLSCLSTAPMVVEKVLADITFHRTGDSSADALADLLVQSLKLFCNR